MNVYADESKRTKSVHYIFVTIKNMEKKFDTIPADIKKRCLTEISSAVEEISGEAVGIIAAQEIIDIVTHYYGPEIYNMALEDTKKLVQEKLTDFEYEIDSLTQSR